MKKFVYTFYMLILTVIFLNINIYASSDALTNRESQAKASLTPLMEIAAYGNLQALKEELAKPDVNVNARDVYGQTALYWAAQNDKYEIISELLQVKDIDAEIADAHGLTPLAIAITNYNTESVDVLLKYFTKSQKKAKCSIIEKRDEKLGYTPLMRAACSGNQAIVKLLLEAGADPTVYVKKDDKTVNATDLVAEKDKEITDLIEAQRKEYTERSLEFKSALEGNKDEHAKKLFTQGIGINAKNEEGYTLLHWVAYSNRKGYAQMLLDAKADVNAKSDDKITPLLSACSIDTGSVDNTEIVELLINNRADINTKNGIGYTSLHCAASYYNNEYIVELLIKKKAEVNAISSRNLTPLHCSICPKTTSGNKKVVELLINNGASVNGTNSEGVSPLFWAIRKGYEDMVELFIKNKADVNAKIQGTAAIHEAAEKASKGIINLLIKANANVNVTDAQGLTPLFYANLHHNDKRKREIIELLTKAGAKRL